MIHAISSPTEPKRTEPDSDAAWVRAAKAGDFGAFEELVNRYERKIYRLALNITGRPEDAEEVLQESFLKTFEHLGDFREDSRFYTWLARIVINEGLMKLRKRRSDRSIPIEDFVTEEGEVIPREFADWGPNPEESLAQSELQAALLEAVESLPFSCRAVCHLRDVEGFSNQETAELLNLSPGAVKTRHHRGCLRLRERLSNIFQEKRRVAVMSTG